MISLICGKPKNKKKKASYVIEQIGGGIRDEGRAGEG